MPCQSKGSHGCRNSNVLATWCVVLTSFTCKDKCPSLILGVGTVVRFFFLLTAFLEARFFFNIIDWKGPIYCCIWGESFSCGMTMCVVGEGSTLDSQWSGAGCDFRKGECLQPSHSEDPCLHFTVPQSHLQKFQFLRCFHLLQLCRFSRLWDEIYIRAGLVLRFCSC